MTALERGTGAIARASNRLFALALLLLLAYILYLPAFPTGDGPLHLYFSNILWSLARHQPDYAHFYAIRHLIAPYSLHYFALIFFQKFVSSANAEKLFVAIIVLNTALGFRFLAGRLGAHAAVASLWMVPLLLTWSLGGGLMNFSFAIGIAYWAFGFWTMLPPHNTYGNNFEDSSQGNSQVNPTRNWLPLAGFLAALLMLILSHPVPLLVLCAFLGADLFLVWIDRRRGPVGLAGARQPGATHIPRSTHTPAGLRLYSFRLAAFALSCLAMVIPTMLADKGKVNAIWPDLHPHHDLLIQLLTGQCIGLFGGFHPLQIVYTLGLLLIVPGAIFLVARGVSVHWHTHTITPAERLLLISTVYLLTTLSFPHSLNGSYYFPQRMWDLLWPLILACAAGAALSIRTLRTLAIAGAALILVFAIVAVSTLSPAARKEAALGQIRLPAGSRGIFVQPESAMIPYSGGFTYPVFYWSGARSVVNSRAILLNSPWLDLSILPVREIKPENGHPGLLIDDQPIQDVEHPFDLLKLVSTPSAARTQVLARSDFLIYANAIAAHPDLHSAVQAILEDQQPQWTCTFADFYAACTRNNLHQAQGAPAAISPQAARP